MKWKEKLEELNKKPLAYPAKISKSFFWETKPITNLNDDYKEIFIENSILSKLKQNYSSFEEHIKKSKNKYVTSFYNLSKTSLLIIPIPKINKNFATLKDFTDNASITQKKEFWKYVSKKIKEFSSKNDKIYVSTHGLGVSYLHIRLDTIPKYYIGDFRKL